MDENLGKFIDDFAQLVQLAQSGQHRVQAGTRLLATLTGHLAVPAESLSVVVEEIPPHRFVDADILMAEIAGEDADFRLAGIGGGDQRHHQSLSDMLQQSQFFPQFPLSQPDYTNLAVGPDEQRQAVAVGAVAVQAWKPPGRRPAAGRQPGTGGSRLPSKSWPAVPGSPRTSCRSSAGGCSTAVS